MRRHSEELCEVCGMLYDELRTGLTFAEVRRMMFVPTDDVTQWRYKRRHCVLGYWRGLKQTVWKHHLDQCLDWLKELTREEKRTLRARTPLRTRAVSAAGRR